MYKRFRGPFLFHAAIRSGANSYQETISMSNTRHPAGSRRRFLRAGGLAAAAGLLGSEAVAAGAAKAAAAQPANAKSLKKHYDVIVVGAGFAGLVAARDCAQRGHSVLLVEARNRVGGRTFTSRYKDHQLELGGTWVHPSQSFVWSEIRRYGLGITESPGATAENTSWITEGKLVNGKMSELYPRMNQAFQQYCDVDGNGGRTVFPRVYDPFVNRAKVAELDKLSLADRLNQVQLTPEMRDLVNAMVVQNCGNDPALGAFVDQLHWFAMCDYDLGMLFDRCGHYKVAEGMSGLANAILADADVDLLLSTPVKSMRQAEGQVTVTTTAGARHSASKVICTVPMNVLKAIDFQPPLMAEKVEASRQEHTGKGLKFYAHVKQKLGVWIGMAPYPNDIILAFTEEERDDGTLLVCFAKPGGVDPNDEEDVQRALRKLLPGVEVAAVMSYAWNSDPYSLGTWCFYRPGQMSRGQEALRATENNIHFASSDSATGWRGFVDGAMQSGIETAQQVHQQLKKGARK